MAGPIENKDLFSSDIFSKTIQDAKALILEMDKLESKIVDVAKVQKEILNQQDNKTIDSVKRTKSAVDTLNEAEKIAIKIRKEKESISQKLVIAESKEAKEIAKLNQQLITQRKINRDLAKEQEGLGKSYSAQSARLNRLRNSYKDLAVQNKGNTKEAKALLIQITSLDTTLKKVDATVGQHQRNVGNYGKALNTIGSTVKKGLGLLGLASGVALVGRAFINAVQITKNFDAANSSLKAVLGATEDEMKALSDNAKALGASTSFTASEVVGLETSFAKLGFPTDDILLMTESTLNAAAAMGSGLEETAALTGATLKAFGLEAKQAGRVNDVLAKSTSASALDFQKLNTAMSTIAPVAKSFGFSVESTTALLGSLSNAGFDASTAATSTRNILLNLADTNGKLAKSLKEPVTDLPSLVRGLNQLKDEGIDLGKALQLTDKRSVAAFQTFLGGTKDLLALDKALGQAGGTAQKMADTQLDNLTGKTKILNSAWEGLVLSLLSGKSTFNDLAQTVVEATTGFISFLTVNETLSDTLQKEADALITLTVTLNDVNTNSSTRLEIIQDLNKNYPELIRNLGFEKVGLENVNEVLQAVNKNMLQRVNIQDAVSEVTDQNNAVSLTAEARQKALANFIFKGTKNLQENGLAHLLVNKTLDEQAKIIDANQTFLQGFTNELKRVENATSDLTFQTSEQSLKLKENREFILGIIKTKKDLENLTTEELRALVKSNILRGLQIQQEAKEIIILRERKKITEDDTEVTEKNTEAKGKNKKAIRELTGVIEKQAKVVSDLSQKIQRATSEEQVLKLSIELDVEQEELKRLQRIVSSSFEEIDKIERDLIEDQTERRIAQEIAKSEKLIEQIESNSRIEEEKKKELIEAENRRLANFVNEEEVKAGQKRIKDAEELAKAEFEQRRTGFESEKEFEKEKAAQFEAIRRNSIEAEIKLLEQFGGQGSDVRIEKLKAELQGLGEIGNGFKELEDLVGAALNAIADMIDETFEKRIEKIGEAIDKTGERIDFLRNKAAGGQLAAEESLAFEQKKEAELEQQRERARKRQERTQALFTVLNTYQANVSSGTPNPLAKTFSDIAVLKGLAGTLAGFYEGADDVGKSLGKPQLPGRDGHIVRVDGKEQIWSDKDRKAVGYRNRDEIKKIVNMHDSGLMQDIINNDHGNSFMGMGTFALNGMMSQKEVVTHLKEVNRSIQKIKIPEGTVAIDDVLNYIKYTQKVGNTKTTKISKLHGN